MPMNIETGAFSLEDPLDDLPPGVVSDLRKLALKCFLVILALEAIVVFILMCVIPLGRPRRTPGIALKAMIVLGSGGHTAEMLKLVSSLDKKTYSPRVYVTAQTDTMSAKKALEAEQGYAPDGKETNCSFYTIPRSREVGQSYFTSVFTTLKAQTTAAAMVWHLKPDVLLVNGPGTCIPICLAAFLITKMMIKHCDIVYVESIARVKSLSLSGKILYRLRLADFFYVQWPDLQKLYPRSQFVDRLY